MTRTEIVGNIGIYATGRGGHTLLQFASSGADQAHQHAPLLADRIQTAIHQYQRAETVHWIEPPSSHLRPNVTLQCGPVAISAHRAWIADKIRDQTPGVIVNRWICRGWLHQVRES